MYIIHVLSEQQSQPFCDSSRKRTLDEPADKVSNKDSVSVKAFNDDDASRD